MHSDLEKLVARDKIDSETAEKIERTNLAPFLSLLPRNLKVIFERTAGKND